MPKGVSECPVCNGKGTLTEDARGYEFVTRDPKTSRCLVCSGRGHINGRTKLPNGQEAHTILSGKRLNVSRKASKQIVPDVGIDLSVPADLVKEVKEVESVVREQEGHWPTRYIMPDGSFLVRPTDPQYLDVLRRARQHARSRGTWSSWDELRYVDALERVIDGLNDMMKETNDA